MDLRTLFFHSSLHIMGNSSPAHEQVKVNNLAMEWKGQGRGENHNPCRQRGEVNLGVMWKLTVTHNLGPDVTVWLGCCVFFLRWQTAEVLACHTWGCERRWQTKLFSPSHARSITFVYYAESFDKQFIFYPQIIIWYAGICLEFIPAL